MIESSPARQPVRALFILAIFMILLQPAVIYAEEIGHNFSGEVKFLYGVLACGGGPLPENIDKAVVKENCDIFLKRVLVFNKNFTEKAAPFFAGLRPANLPKTVCYPFGGSDMISAFVTYPDAEEIITISLESAGDPRRLAMVKPAEFREGVSRFREIVCNTMDKHDNTNIDVRTFERGIIPSQLAFSLAAAAAYGCEPVSLKFFRITDDGKLGYYSLKDIASLENVIGKRLASFWVDTDYSVAFRNMEVTYINKATGKKIIHRHVAANLNNGNFAGSGLEKYLGGMGKISAMTKAASYLLWMDDFTAVRGLMLRNMAFMISDSTGILPRHASAAGFEQITFGKFHGAFLENNGGEKAEEFRKLWNSQPYRPVDFRYGFSDIMGSNHVLITRPRNKTK